MWNMGTRPFCLLAMHSLFLAVPCHSAYVPELSPAQVLLLIGMLSMSRYLDRLQLTAFAQTPTGYLLPSRKSRACFTQMKQ